MKHIRKVKNVIEFFWFFAPHFYRLLDTLPYDQWVKVTFDIKVKSGNEK